MKNKNTFIFLLLIFSIICAYNIYYTVVRIGLDSELSTKTQKEQSEYFKNKENYENYKNVITKSMGLGLDLQGGMYITMQVGVDNIVEELAGRPKDQTFVKAVANARARTSTSQKPFIDLFYEEIKAIDPNVKLSLYFSKKTGLSYNASNDDVIAKIKEEAEAAIDNSFKIIRTRIDQFGVTSPNIQKVLGTGKILIELPGVKNPERVRNLLRGTAKLEFWPAYTLDKTGAYLTKIDAKLKELNAGKGSDSLPTDSSKASQQTNEQKNVAENKKATEALLGEENKGENKPDSGKAAVTAQNKDKENPLFALLAPPDGNKVGPNSCEAGYAKIADTAAVNQILSNPEIRRLLPDDLVFLWSAKPLEEDQQKLTLITVRSNKERIAPLDGTVIIDTRTDQDQNKRNAVSMTMNSEGAQKWRTITQENLGKPVVVVLDNMVYTYPMVQSVIANGSSQITGNFSLDEARDLANILKAGKLPAPVNIEGEEEIGPTLGAETIQRGYVSFIFGFLAVIIFMAWYYQKAGLIADLALLINLFFILGISSAFNVVLTLPGIAGIVLTMGMAVDSNVLIYERIREELADGKSIKGAIQAGFSNALSSIVDSNITTLLSGIILYVFGTGPIRGFAVTLVIGIVTTLICALIITRLILEYITRNPDKTNISFGSVGLIAFFKRMNFNFIGKRSKAYVVILAIAVISLGSSIGLGFKLGVDFSGGRQYVVQMSKEVNVDDLRNSLTNDLGGKTPAVKTVGINNQMMITTDFMQEDVNADDKVRKTVIEGLKRFDDKVNDNPGTSSILRSTKVGATVADDIKTAATWSIVFSLLTMFLYVFARFTHWQFGLGALLSLSFNVLAVLGIYSLLGQIPGLPFSVELDQSFIAAILTIIGYDINDTVIIYDRIRENLRDDKLNTPRETLFNRSINETLSRTTITSLTTLLTAFILFAVGGVALQSFMFAIVMGIIVGTCTSIFVASPITLDLWDYMEKRSKDSAPAVATTTK